MTLLDRLHRKTANVAFLHRRPRGHETHEQTEVMPGRDVNPVPHQEGLDALLDRLLRVKREREGRGALVAVGGQRASVGEIRAGVRDRGSEGSQT